MGGLLLVGALALLASCDAFDLAANFVPKDDGGLGASNDDGGGDPCNEALWATPVSGIVTVSCGDVQVDLLTSAANCGYCGHDCGTEMCEAGRCRPRTETSALNFNSVTAAGATPARFLYTATTGVNKERVLARSAGADEQVLLSSTKFDAIATLGDDAFGFSRGTVYRRGLADAMQQSYAFAPATATLFAVTATSNFASDRVRIYERAFNDAGAQRDITAVDPPLTVTSLVGSAERVYWITSGDGIRRPMLGSFSQETGLAATVMTNDIPHSLAAAGGIAVFADAKVVRIVRAATPTAVETIEGSNGVADYDAHHGLPRVATDGKFVFWLRPDGPGAGPVQGMTLVRKSLCSGRIVEMAVGEATEASGLYATRARVYWIAPANTAAQIVVRSVSR